MTLVPRRRAVRTAGAAVVLLVATACASGTAPSTAAPSSAAGASATGLDRTYFAWYGPTTPSNPAYFRVTGPTVVIEYAPQGAGGGPGGGPPSGGAPPSGAPQGGGGTPDAQAGAAISSATTDHIHGIYRDPTDEYGAKYAS
jgi:hypothetical protein